MCQWEAVGWSRSAHTVYSGLKTHTHTSRSRKIKWGEEILPSETVTETFDELHKKLKHVGPQVKQNTKAADASRRDGERKMPDRLSRTKVGYNWGIDRHTGGDPGWDWQMPGGSDLQRSIWVTVWWVTCRGDPRRHWHSRSLKRLQDVVLLLLLHSWNQTEGGRLVRARLG